MTPTVNTLEVGSSLLADLRRSGAITRTGINPAVFDATLDECEALAALCGEVKDVSSWLVGDLIGYSERKFGEIAPQIIAATGLAPSTLENLASVSRKIPPEQRVEGVKHSTHALVQKLPPREQTRWLTEAKQHGWSRADLKARLVTEQVEQNGGCEHQYVCRRCGEMHP